MEFESLHAFSSAFGSWSFESFVCFRVSTECRQPNQTIVGDNMLRPTTLCYLSSAQVIILSVIQITVTVHMHHLIRDIPQSGSLTCVTSEVYYYYYTYFIDDKS